MAGPSILVVEDNHLLRWCVCSGLKEHGYSVRAASSAEDAQRMNFEEPVCVLITDWRLENMGSGFEVLERMKQRFPQISSILISAEADPQLSSQAQRRGFDYVIEKPCPLADILHAVSLLTGNSASPETRSGGLEKQNGETR
jgi:CheY-like chemotaxis protein